MNGSRERGKWNSSSSAGLEKVPFLPGSFKVVEPQEGQGLSPCPRPDACAASEPLGSGLRQREGVQGLCLQTQKIGLCIQGAMHLVTSLLLNICFPFQVSSHGPCRTLQSLFERQNSHRETEVSMQADQWSFHLRQKSIK